MSAVPGLLTVLAAFWLPGLAVGTALRLRGWTLAAGAPALTFGLVALGAVVIGNLGMRWTLLSFGAWTVLLTLLCLGGSWLLNRRARQARDPDDDLDRKRPGRKDHLLVAAGVVSGMAVGAITFLRGIGSLATLSQEWDAPKHANFVRWIAENGNPLPSALAPIAGVESDNFVFFDPNTYHVLLALLLDRANLGIPELLNLAALAVVLAWPLGIAALGLAWRMPPLGVAVAAAVSTWFSTFPYDSLWRGPLWPFVAGVALVPALLAIARHLIVPLGLAGPVGVPLALAGLVGLHPSVMFVVLVYALTLFGALVLGLEPVNWRRAWPTMVAAGGAAIAAVVPVILPALGPSEGVTAFRWPQVATPVEAFGQAVLFSPVTPFPQWFLGAAAIVGIVLLVLHRRVLWIVAAYACFAAVYIGCASLDNALVNTLTGPFYNDSWRFAALLPLPGAIAAGEFGATVAMAVTDRVVRTRVAANRVRPPLGGRFTAFALPAGVAVTVLVVLAVLGGGAYVDRNATRLATVYHDGPTISSDELAAYRWIAEHDNTGRVMNDPYDGSVWMYALTKLRPVEWNLRGPDGHASALLLEELNRRGDAPEVERALSDLDVHYVVVGTGFVRADLRRAPGLVGLAKVPGLRRVYENANAAVYEVLPVGTSAASGG